MPKRGEKKDLVDHALLNAREALGRVRFELLEVGLRLRPRLLGGGDPGRPLLEFHDGREDRVFEFACHLQRVPVGACGLDAGDVGRLRALSCR